MKFDSVGAMLRLLFWGPHLSGKYEGQSFPSLLVRRNICGGWKYRYFAVTKYHRLAGLNNRNLFLIVLEAGSPRWKLAGLGFFWGFSVLQMAAFLLPLHKFFFSVPVCSWCPSVCPIPSEVEPGHTLQPHSLK